MKNLGIILSVVFLCCVIQLSVMAGGSVDFGDYTSSVLVQKAWKALADKDLKSTEVYANKVVELYAVQARAMQQELKAFPDGSKEEIFKYWALNDVATGLFILAEAYKNDGQEAKTLKIYQEIIDGYGYAQCWDPNSWFWQVADVAQDKLDMAEAGVNMDFGDYTSKSMVQKAWSALEGKDVKRVKFYAEKMEQLYGKKAEEMQALLNTMHKKVWKNKEKIYDYWALNDVGTGLFILGEAYRGAGQTHEAQETYQRLIDKYKDAQSWDRQGWFWKPAEIAKKRIREGR